MFFVTSRPLACSPACSTTPCLLLCLLYALFLLPCQLLCLLYYPLPALLPALRPPACSTPPCLLLCLLYYTLPTLLPALLLRSLLYSPLPALFLLPALISSCSAYRLCWTSSLPHLYKLRIRPIRTLKYVFFHNEIIKTKI